jgi:hypothetical protein
MERKERQKSYFFEFLRCAACFFLLRISCGVSKKRRRLHSEMIPACITARRKRLTTESAGSDSPTNICVLYVPLNHRRFANLSDGSWAEEESGVEDDERDRFGWNLGEEMGMRAWWGAAAEWECEKGDGEGEA